MTGTELEIIPPERSQIAGSDAERQPSLQTTARTDLELLAVWLKSHVDGSDCGPMGGSAAASSMPSRSPASICATLDDVQTALETIRVKLDGAPAKAATVNANVAIVKRCSSRSLKDLLLILEKIDKAGCRISVSDRACRHDDACWAHDDADARQLC